MTLVVAVTVAAAMLAVGAGLGKLAVPGGAVDAMRATRLPSSRTVVRAVAVTEVCVGVLVLTSPSSVGRVLLAVLFASVAAFAVLSVRRGADVPCGCFGAGTRPIGVRHVVVDATIVVAASVSLLVPGYPRDPVFGAGLLAGVGVLALSVCTAALTAALLARGTARVG